MTRNQVTHRVRVQEKVGEWVHIGEEETHIVCFINTVSNIGSILVYVLVKWPTFLLLLDLSVSLALLNQSVFGCIAFF